MRIKKNFWLIISFCLLLFLFYGCKFSAKKNKVQAPYTGWEKIGPGGGGSTYIPTFSYSSPNNFLVRCDMTGSYFTNDGGASYHQINFANGSSAYAFNPQDSNIIYIGSAALNRSTDGGKTWEQIFPKKTEIKRELYHGDEGEYSIETTDSSLYKNESGSIKNIRVDPVRAALVYFSMGFYFYYTTDNGNTWKIENLQQTIDYIYTNNSSLKDEVFIFTSSSFFIFNKLSNTFKHKQIPAAMHPAFSFTGGVKAKTDSVIFYTLHHEHDYDDDFDATELWMSNDKGETWKPVSDSIITNKQHKIKPNFSMVSCAEFDASQAYVVSNLYQEKKKDGAIRYWYGAIKTSDAGNSWNWVWKGGGGSGKYGVKDGIGVANLTDAWAEKGFGGEFIGMGNVGVFPADGNIAILTDWYRTMKTMDGGKTWIQVTSNMQPDGTFSSRGMDVTTTYGVHFDSFDSNHIAVSYTDIGFQQSFNGGKSWTRSVDGVPDEWVNTCYWMVFDPNVKGKIWSAWSGMHDIPRTKMTRSTDWKETCKGGICVSTNGGKTWKTSNEGIGDNSTPTSVVIDTKTPVGKRTLYASVYNKGVFKSIDDGKTWQLKNKGIEANTAVFEITLAANGNLFVTTTPVPMYKDGKVGREFYSGAVYKSTDGAETWAKLNVVNGPLFPNGIDVDSKNLNRIYLACWGDIELSDLIGGKIANATGGNKNLGMDGGIFLSEDGGKTWVSIFDKKQYVYDVTVDPYHAGRVYCNTFNKAAYRSDDYGQTWKKIKGYDFHWGHRIIIDENNREKIYITTYGSSVWHGVPEVE